MKDGSRGKMRVMNGTCEKEKQTDVKFLINQ